ncbi:MAG: dihydropteroate synthase [Aeromicrobium sp.]
MVASSPLGGLPTRRCLVMGVINVTPDSFSDGGKWLDAKTAIAHGIDLVAGGADIVDVGGESTRPGALRIDADEELRRVIPVVKALAAEGIPISVDTMRASVAQQSLDAGAIIVNDVSGGRADPEMFDVAARSGKPLVLMHWREHSQTMQNNTDYDDVVADVIAELRVQIDAAHHAGVADANLIVDPGLGFSKTADQNWTVLRNLDTFAALGYPLLVAASRKRFLGELLADGDIVRPTDEREAATAALTAFAAEHGAWCVRVHEPAASADAVRVIARLQAEA